MPIVRKRKSKITDIAFYEQGKSQKMADSLIVELMDHMGKHGSSEEDLENINRFAVNKRTINQSFPNRDIFLNIASGRCGQTC